MVNQRACSGAVMKIEAVIHLRLVIVQRAEDGTKKRRVSLFSRESSRVESAGRLTDTRERHPQRSKGFLRAAASITVRLIPNDAKKKDVIGSRHVLPPRASVALLLPAETTRAR